MTALDQSLLARGALDQLMEKVLLERTQVNRTRLWGGHQISLLRVLPSILSYFPILRYFREAVLVMY